VLILVNNSPKERPSHINMKLNPIKLGELLFPLKSAEWQEAHLAAYSVSPREACDSV